MIVRKVKPGIMQIIDIDPVDEVESFALLDVSDKDAFRLLTKATGFESKDGVTTIRYNNGDDVDTMFKAIAGKHKKSNPDFQDVSKKYHIKDISQGGTSVLLRDGKKHVIKVARRSTTKSTEGNINRLFITNAERDLFFKEADKSATRAKTGLYMLSADLDHELYEKWSGFMNKRYLEIIQSIAK